MGCKVIPKSVGLFHCVCRINGVTTIVCQPEIRPFGIWDSLVTLTQRRWQCPSTTARFASESENKVLQVREELNGGTKTIPVNIICNPEKCVIYHVSS
jgi:hypothetical protein